MSNIFPRHTLAGHINIDGRASDYGSEPLPSAYEMVLTISPEQIEPGQASVVRLVVTKDGVPQQGLAVTFGTNNGAVGNVDPTGITNSNGEVVFSVVALVIGAATITAEMVVDGETYISNGVTMLVVTKEAQENYDATGYGRVVLKVENAFANMLHPRPLRMSHMEQIKKGGDTGLSRSGNYEATEVVFMPSWILKR